MSVARAAISVLFMTLAAVAVGPTTPAVGLAAESGEPLLRDLPPGTFLESCAEVAADQDAAIGRKLGGRIERLTNSVLRVQGRSIQVNVITAADDGSAEAIHAALTNFKSFPFCLRRDRRVIEYVGRDVDNALAMKTSYELGLIEKPARVRYGVTAELAAVDEADYMACTPLFQQFLEAGRDADRDALERLEELARGFRFGHTLVLRNPDLGPQPAAHGFEPPPAATRATEAGASYSFESLPERHGVPHVTAHLEITVDDTGFVADPEQPGAVLTAATPFWPADDPEVIALARQITGGAATADEKAGALLEWLAPGRNLEYRGRTGSRWGTLRVLEQKFGHCWDFADCFVTLARAAGVPCRQVAGWLYGSSGHVWAEYYRGGEGWQQVDPTGGGRLRCGIYHIPYFTTEDGAMPVVYLAMPEIEVVETR